MKRVAIFYSEHTEEGIQALFGSHREYFLALHFYFDAEGWTQIGALNNRAARPNVSRKIAQFERVVDRAAAGVSHHRMPGGAKTVVVFQLAQVRDVFELAIAKRGFFGKGPVAT